MMGRALTSAGVDFSVATTDDDGFRKRLTQEGLRSTFDEMGLLTSRASQYHIFAKRTEFYKVAPSFRTWLLSNAKRYDLLHIHALFSYTSWAAADVARRQGIPYVIRPLGTLTRYGIEKRRPWLKQLSLRCIEAPNLRNASAVHFTSIAERDEAEALGIAMRSVVLPLAVEQGQEPDLPMLYARYPRLSRSGYLLYLSRLDPKKNIEVLLEAFSVLVRIHNGLTLAIVGDGPGSYVSALKARASILGIDSHVVWAGFLDGALKAAALKGATLFILPSFSENFGIAAAEALLAGLPCILGQGVAIATEIEAAGAGLSIEPTSQAVVAAVQRYLNSPAELSSASRNARNYALSHYSVEAMGDGLLKLYEGILNRAMSV